MKTNDFLNSTLFQDRDFNNIVFPPRRPARFSSEPEGEGLELCLRGLLVACLFAGLTVCGVRLDGVARTHGSLPALPDAHTSVAMTQPAEAPAAKTL